MQVAGRVAAGVLLLPVLVVVVVRLLGVGDGFPWSVLLTVFPWLLGIALAGTAVAAAARWWSAAGAGALVVLVGAAVLVPRMVAATQPSSDGPTLTVAVANLRIGAADPEPVVAAVAEHDVDVLVTLELTDAAIEGLTTAGLDELLPSAVLEPSRFTSGGGIHSRLPLVARAPDTDRGFGRTPRATLAVPGAGDVLVDAVHPLPPINPDWTTRWRSALAGLPDPSGVGAPTRLLAGDFNATLDHPPLRDLIDRGWVDAADAGGAGLVPTFNALPYGEPVPPVTLDHVLVDRRTAVEAIDVRPLPRSDHRLLVVRVRLPAG